MSSEDVLAVLLSFGLLGGIFLWVPLLEIVYPPCSRFLRARRRGRTTWNGTEHGAESVPDLA